RQLRDDLAKATCGAILPVAARIAPRLTAEYLPLLTSIISPFRRPHPPPPKPPPRNGDQPPPDHPPPPHKIREVVSSALLAAAAAAKPITDKLSEYIDHYWTEVMTAEQAFHYIHNYAKCWDSEFCIENDPQAVAAAWREVQATILDWQSQ